LSDEAGAAEFCRHIHAPLVGALSLYCGDRWAAEELAQEALARVWERWRQVERMDHPSAWTYRTAFNLAASWFRRRRAEQRARARLDALTTSEAVEGATADSLAVRQLVASLPKRQRIAVVCRYLLDMPVVEVSWVMDCAPGTVKALTNRAIARLREQMNRELEVDRA
jgi:RNA polymerase sigma factor (sigma-70 family)